MTRFPDWQSRLDRFLRANRETPFEWGTWDCCLWVCSAIESMTDVDIAAEWRGKYTTAMGASKVMLDAGARTVSEMAAIVAEMNGMRAVPLFHEQRGDMAVVLNEASGECLGLVALNGLQVIVVKEDGLTLIDTKYIVRAWRVG